MIREIVNREEVVVKKIPILDNLADPFTKTLTEKLFFKHLEGMGLKEMSYLLYDKWEIVRNVLKKIIYVINFIEINKMSRYFNSFVWNHIILFR